MHLKLNELDAASGLCEALRDVQGLSTEQKSLLASKENEIVVARQAARGQAAQSGRKATAWQQKLDQAQMQQHE